MFTFLMIGAHPDDMDLRCGGLATRLKRKGHNVIFLSMTNGNAGHMSMEKDVLRERRLSEMREAALRYGGIRYETFDIDDGYLAADIPTRDRLIRFIRKETPDVIITHRTCDYHPDHRACGQLVCDSCYLVGVPMICPDTPAMGKHPAILSCEDRFSMPVPFRPDVCVPIDDAIEAKVQGMLCHASQMYEWLPYDGHWQDVLSAPDRESQTEALRDRFHKRFSATVKRFPDSFPRGTVYGEAFQRDEYGTPLSEELYRVMTAAADDPL